MAVNYLGPFVFTRTLLPLLESTAANGDDVRIINVGSSGHKDVTHLDYSSKEAWNHKFNWSLLPTMSRYSESSRVKYLLHMPNDSRIFQTRRSPVDKLSRQTPCSRKLQGDGAACTSRCHP
ncbi:uncharacterized protein LACBIDRAFT_296995 [Laccaria bicolor S238N-H82]|uniref:Predicted protein n=1 Tax=Laccaria bicolor (strain S238N-H82 / ATCC MYA-4686) TaxID=486041 RepID=B0D9R2_LACBS|nr:uncharacterized protein LACBIDRAFT_296995 [Laccaria bicolor S238N-H82]EDR08626.1 predicted protein [Laccaria bicolor S238N-H82]|eukprot:XP_001880851.1 predicted protein [Laccaria bicolor S238N-H82]